MKILVSAYACDPTRGSENKISWSWYEYYLKQGHEVWLLTLPWGKVGIEKTLASMKSENAHVCYVRIPSWIEKRHTQRKGSLWVYLHYIIFQQLAYWVSRKLAKTIDFDVVHHVSWGSIQMGTALWRLKKPLLFGPVGGGQFPPDGFESYFETGWEKEIRRRKVSDLLLRFYPDSKKTLQKANMVWVVNKETYDMARLNGAKHVEYFLDASFDLDPTSLLPAEQRGSKKLRLIWVGRLLPRKALSFTFEVLDHLPQDIPFHLDVYGDGEMGHRVSEWIQQRNLQDRITWHGQVPWEEVLEAYQDADVFMFNSLRDTFGVQLIEAMTAALPIVCLDLHGAATFVPNEAALKISVTTPQETAQKMAEGIKYLFEHPEKRRKMGEVGRKFALQQNLKYKSQRVESTLRKIATPALNNAEMKATDP